MILAAQSFLFMEGDVGQEMYFLRSGRVQVLKREDGRTRILAELGAGAILGEMSLLDHQPRSAAVLTLEESEFEVIDHGTFDAALESLPSWMRSMFLVVVGRLRETVVHRARQVHARILPGLLFLLSQAVRKGQCPIPYAPLLEDLRLLQGISRMEANKAIERLARKELLAILDNPSGREVLLLAPTVLERAHAVLVETRCTQGKCAEVLTAQSTSSLRVLLELWKVDQHRQESMAWVDGSQLLQALSSRQEDDPELVGLFRLVDAGHVQCCPVREESGWAIAGRVEFCEPIVTDLVKLQDLLADCPGF
jgi:CRP-like cAMP-binding protein